MSKSKKQLPISLLEAIQESVQFDSPVYEIIESKNILKAIDRDSNSDFFFQVENHMIEQGKLRVQLRYKPRNRDYVEEFAPKIDIKNLNEAFTKWGNLILEYEKIEIFEDPLLKQYEEEFLSDFEILDVDADTNSYDLNTQIVIDNYLKYLEEKLLENKTEANIEETNQILEEVNDLKENQTNLTKRKVINRLAKIWAKTRKIGLKLLKEVYEEAKKEIIKQLIRGNIEM
jgi:hypothetical protein